MNKKRYIVKGRIREFVKWGKKGQLRKGAYQFLPNTEVILTENNSTSYIKYQNRFYVRGRSKSGLFTTKGIYFKYLFDFNIEEVVNPNAKTLRFIRNNEIILFEEERKNEIVEWLEYFEEVSIAEKLTGEITDEIFKKAQKFVQNMQEQISRNEQFELLEKYFEFPILVRHFTKLKEDATMERERFELKMKDYFLEDICNSIAKTDLSSIFPTDTKLLIGNVEATLDNLGDFRITKVIYTKKHGTK